MADGGTAIFENSCRETVNSGKQLGLNAFFDAEKRQVAYVPC